MLPSIRKLATPPSADASAQVQPVYKPVCKPVCKRFHAGTLRWVRFARQAISHGAVEPMGHELTFRWDAGRDRTDEPPSPYGVCMALSHALLDGGLKHRAAGSVFVTLDEETLLSTVADALCAPHFIIQLPRSLPVEPQITRRIAQLHAAGYHFALAELGGVTDPRWVWAPLVRYAKLQVAREAPEGWAGWLRRAACAQMEVVVEGLAEPADYLRLRRLGVRQFQGSLIHAAQEESVRALPCCDIQVLHKLNRLVEQGASRETLAMVSATDPALVIRLLMLQKIYAGGTGVAHCFSVAMDPGGWAGPDRSPATYGGDGVAGLLGAPGWGARRSRGLAAVGEGPGEGADRVHLADGGPTSHAPVAHQAGWAGAQRSAGVLGVPGPSGSGGVIGPAGMMGPMGPMGPMGQMGPMGAVGPIGLTGLVGAIGVPAGAGRASTIGASSVLGAQDAHPAHAAHAAHAAPRARGAVATASPTGVPAIFSTLDRFAPPATLVDVLAALPYRVLSGWMRILRHSSFDPHESGRAWSASVREQMYNFRARLIGARACRSPQELEARVFALYRRLCSRETWVAAAAASAHDESEPTGLSGQAPSAPIS